MNSLSSDVDSEFSVGSQPDFAPRLSMRIVPPGGKSTLSSATVRDAIDHTQRILTYSAYEVVNGFRPDFADLRLVDKEIAEFATLQIEPFAEGSFIIPAALKEGTKTISSRGQNHELTGGKIVQHFTDVMENATDRDVRASEGMMQAIENLNSILRREAETIEYSASGIPGAGEVAKKIVVDEDFVKKISENRKQRQDPQEIPDKLEGVLVAVNIDKSSLVLKIGQQSINGSFSPFLTDMMVQSLRKKVSLHGVVVYRGHRPAFIRAIFGEVLPT